MNLTQEIVTTATRHPYAVLLVGIFAENAGLPIPGELLVLLVAATAGSSGASLPAIGLAAAAGAVLGDNFSYWIGRRGGRFLIDSICRVTCGSLDCGDRIIGLYRRFGPGSVSVARFIPAVRALMAPVAGLARMRWTQFMVFDALGAALWAALFVAGGRLVGEGLVRTMERFHVLGRWAFAALIAAAGARLAYRMLKRRKYGAASPEALRHTAYVQATDRE